MAGLRLAGFDVSIERPVAARPGDVLLIWNRYWDNDRLATEFERQGGTVLVAENGYLDPSRYGQRSWYALAIGGHNGQGEWFPGGPERWQEITPQLGAELKPWRDTGGHILVCPNRSFGRPGFIMPENWAERTAAELRTFARRPVRVRPHPGNVQPRLPLQADLDGCWAVVIWGSSAGVHALLAGIPVISMAPAWVCEGAAYHGIEFVLTERPELDIDREAAFERMAWAQWHIDEIASGVPFRHLLRAA